MNSRQANWKLAIYILSLLLIIAGVVSAWMRWPYARLLTNLGFTPYVLLKIAGFMGTRYRYWHWTDKIRFALALFMGAMLILRYIDLYNSDLYFMLALAVDYIVGRQLSVRKGDA
jgi:hypothetical protein